jgi:hypothetical protein
MNLNRRAPRSSGAEGDEQVLSSGWSVQTVATEDQVRPVRRDGWVIGIQNRVTFHSRDVPQCFLKWRILDFTNTRRTIWVRTRYRECKRCGRKYLGFVAVMRRDEEEYARMNGLPDPPCCRGCE